MHADELLRHGAHVMTVCNACRYCEQYCPVFPAMEQRLVFEKQELVYLANLCHNCGECLFACQYAPPHEFGIDVPRTFARIRHYTYDECAWPGWLAAAFDRQGIVTALTLAVAFTILLLAGVLIGSADAAHQALGGRFYAVIPHGVLVALFGTVGLGVLAALIVGSVRCWRGMGATPLVSAGAPRALHDAFTLKHLHGGGADCATLEDHRTPWRRWLHHCTLYGFLLCFASTSVAAVYHARGFEAPYAYASLPVGLGTIGGLGLLVGPAGLWILRRRRDPALSDPDRTGPDEAFLALLFLVSLTGLLLLVLRNTAFMGVLLVAHLGVVLALFVTLPYGKFVHGVYRTLALLKWGRETPS